jgi:biotin carboxyl carrier protein
MKISASLFVAGSVLLLAASEFIPMPGVGFIGNAHAIIGAPRTPLSVAGVARRTAVRTTAVVTTEVAASSAAAASAASAQAAAASSQAAAAQAAAAKPPAPAPAPSAGPLAVGTVVGKLPSGCVSAPVSGVEYYLCNGTYYRAAFQGNNLVYVVSKP